MQPKNERIDNQLLARLPVSVLRRLEPHLASVYLDRKETLFRAYEPLQVAYFPSTAVISLVTRLESGEMLEVGLIGREGLAGSAVLPGMAAMSCEAVVQVPGRAWRIDANVLKREAAANAILHDAIGRFAHLLLARSMHMSACNMFHPVEQRCVRWLLTVADLTQQNNIPLTHDLLATMLGVRRPTVTLVLRSLHDAHLVDEARGRVTIRDRARLEAACCECYRTMQQAQAQLLDQALSPPVYSR